MGCCDCVALFSFLKRSGNHEIRVFRDEYTSFIA